MLLGFGLHASLAYFSYPWPVQDSARSLAFGLAYAAIHGFRMPLFFLLSGFFTMLVFRRRGVRYTPIGWLLHGPRTPPRSAAASN